MPGRLISQRSSLGHLLLACVALTAACDGSGASSLTDASATDASATDAVATGGGYVPDVDVPYDGKSLNGSFEENQGFGWDTCFTHTDLQSLQIREGGASDQNHYLVLQSNGDCSGPLCQADNPSASQIYTFVMKGADAIAPKGFYFDVINLGATPPTGALRLYGTDQLCRETATLAEMPLAELAPGPTWATRCVDIVAPEAHYAIGLAASGTYEIGLDAFRLGPRCHP